MPEGSTRSPHRSQRQQRLEQAGAERSDRQNAHRQTYLSLWRERASEFHAKGVYRFEGKDRSSAQMQEYYEDLLANYPLVSIEDPLNEDDWEGWSALTASVGNRVQLVGDDLFVTNPTRLADGISKHAANSLLVKVNQIGTLSETLDAVSL